MNAQLLIDAIVRQTTVLIAQLATASGLRAHLAHIAQQVFLDLAREIEAQGVSRKIAADMFSMTLRTYQMRTQRLATSGTHRDRTLWEAILAYLQDHGSASRKEMLGHFADDHPNDIGAVLHDLAQSGFVEKVKSPGGPKFAIRAPDTPQSRQPPSEAIEALVWVAIYRGAGSLLEIVSRLGLSAPVVSGAVEALRGQGRVNEESGHLTATTVILPIGAEHGWEAAVFDHYHAVVAAIAQKALLPVPRSASDDVVGGTTIAFEMYPHHPLRDEVRGLLQRVRADVNELWKRVGELNQQGPGADAPIEVVSFYFGQSTHSGES